MKTISIQITAANLNAGLPNASGILVTDGDAAYDLYLSLSQGLCVSAIPAIEYRIEQILGVNSVDFQFDFNVSVNPVAYAWHKVAVIGDVAEDLAVKIKACVECNLPTPVKIDTEFWESDEVAELSIGCAA